MEFRRCLQEELDRLKKERRSYLYNSWADIQRQGFDKVLKVAKLHGKIEMLEWVLDCERIKKK